MKNAYTFCMNLLCVLRLSRLVILKFHLYKKNTYSVKCSMFLNTLRTGDADLCFYITTVQDG